MAHNIQKNYERSQWEVTGIVTFDTMEVWVDESESLGHWFWITLLGNNGHTCNIIHEYQSVQKCTEKRIKKIILSTYAIIMCQRIVPTTTSNLQIRINYSHQVLNKTRREDYYTYGLQIRILSQG